MKVYRNSLIASALLFLVFVVFQLTSPPVWNGWLLTLALALLGVGFRGYKSLKGFAYTVMIFAAVTASLYYPQHFIQVGDYKLSKLIVPLLQIIMFGMGAALSLRDFAGVVRMPYGVLVGIVCQFSIMPAVGYTLTRVFQFPPEVAAGVILVGCSPSGLASNVMSFLARANLALSVTLTAIATLLAPLLTPVLMKWLAGQLIPIDVWGMMWSMIKIVIIPVVAGLVFNHLFAKRFKWLDTVLPLISMGGIAVIIVIITAAGRDSLLTIGLILILATFLHNTIGYGLGYLLSRLLGLSERDCRTVALEVGLQNAGLASGIAVEMGRVATVGLAPAVFGPLMNITGSALATWWRGRPLPEGETERLGDGVTG